MRFDEYLREDVSGLADKHRQAAAGHSAEASKHKYGSDAHHSALEKYHQAKANMHKHLGNADKVKKHKKKSNIISILHSKQEYQESKACTF